MSQETLKTPSQRCDKSIPVKRIGVALNFRKIVPLSSHIWRWWYPDSTTFRCDTVEWVVDSLVFVISELLPFSGTSECSTASISLCGVKFEHFLISCVIFHDSICGACANWLLFIPNPSRNKYKYLRQDDICGK